MKKSADRNKSFHSFDHEPDEQEIKQIILLRDATAEPKDKDNARAGSNFIIHRDMRDYTYFYLKAYSSNSWGAVFTIRVDRAGEDQNFRRVTIASTWVAYRVSDVINIPDFNGLFPAGKTTGARFYVGVGN